MRNDAWPERDPLSPDGVRFRTDSTTPVKVNQVMHSHTCPDGTEIECTSQWISVTRVTLDKWRVYGRLIATSSRSTPHTEPPDFGWADRRTSVA